MFIQKLSNFISILKKQSHNKQLVFSYPKFKNLEIILQHLYEAHFISGFNIISGDKVKIFLNFTNNGKTLIREIKLVSKIKFRCTVSAIQLKQYKHHYPYSLALIETRQGIKPLNYCIKNNIGGNFLFYIH